MSALIAGQHEDGGFGGDPYRKWTGAHWRLVSLAELAAPASDPRVAAAAAHVLAWIVDGLRHPPRVVDGLPRSHASIHGNALGACTRLGLAADERTQRLAEDIISWQWPDGGWKWDNRGGGHRSSFHESLRTAWGLQEYATATGHAGAREAAGRAVELFLQHRVFRRGGTGKPINPRWLSMPYPLYWHYRRALRPGRHRARGPVHRPGGFRCLGPARAEAQTGRKVERAGTMVAHRRQQEAPEVVDWGRAGEPNAMVTRNALRVLAAAGRVNLNQ